MSIYCVLIKLCMLVCFYHILEFILQQYLDILSTVFSSLKATFCCNVAEFTQVCNNLLSAVKPICNGTLGTYESGHYRERCLL